jgi:hypothetical protein
MMSIGDSSHGVYLEVLVRTDMGNCFNWTPVSEGWLSIIEPLVTQLLKVISIDMGNSLGNLSSSESSVEKQHVLTDLTVDTSKGLVAHELVVKMVSASVNLDIVEEMRVHGWKADTAVVHLSSEDLVTKEVVSEDTSIRVSHIVAVSSSNIWEITEEGMHGIVLLVAVIKMLGMLINSEFSEHVFEKKE